MDTVLLATKIRIPPQPQHAVLRTRLIDALEQGIPRHPLAWLAAPAGYGKTTLLAQWAHTSRLQIAWLALGAEDNDLERFLRYLLAAWETVQPDIRDSPFGVLLGGMAPDRDAALTAFVNVTSDTSGHTVFVLDDYHLIEEPSIHQALAFLLDHLPPTVHVVLAGRSRPPLPLARYRAQGVLLELHTEDLQFRPDETAEFLNRRMGLELSDDQIAQLHAQLEGWIAGLQLLSLTRLHQREPTPPIAISGTHRFIADYLGAEVLARLPEAGRRFLVQTSILDRLCASLCDAIAGGGSQAMLEWLEQENMFLVPLDDDRAWFRYHRLFAEYLQAELRRHYPAKVAELHRRAARWYFEHELPEQAFDHAVAGDSPELVMGIFERYLNLLLNSGQLKLVARWLDALPSEWYAAYPLLGLGRAGPLAFTGPLDACLRIGPAQMTVDAAGKQYFLHRR